MQISNSTLFITYAPLLNQLNDGTKDALKEQAPRAIFGAAGFYSMTIAQFAAIVNNDIKSVFPNIEKPNKLTLYEYITIRELPTFIDSYIKGLTALIPPTTADEERAQKACKKVEMIEGLIIFARNYFNLPSFADAENTTLGDLLIAKKDAYNAVVFQKAYNKILNNKKR